MKTKYFAALLSCAIQPAMAIPLDQVGSAVTLYSSYNTPDTAVGIVDSSYCTSHCGPDAVYENESRVVEGAHGDHNDIHVTRLAEYASDSHRVGVNTSLTTPQQSAGQYIYSSNGHGDARAGGYADVANTKMGVHAQSETNNSGAPAQAQASSAIRNQVTIKAGNSGLQDGDLVRMVWNLRLDGDLGAGGMSYPTGSNVSSTMAAYFSIETPSTDGGEATVTSLADFRSRASLAGGDVTNGGHSYASSWDYRFVGSTNTGDDYFAQDSHDSYWDDPDTIFGDYLSIDSGFISLQFDAVVGSTLDLIGTLDVFTYTSQTGYAYASFLHTFANSLVSTVNGVDLDWQIDGSVPTAAVPEPASMALLGLGLMALMYARRRQNAEQL